LLARRLAGRLFPPHHSLWQPQDVYGASARLSGWQPSPRGIIKLHDAKIEG
jgi:hypothetical protein